MRHLKAGRKLSRSGAHRKALLRNLVTALVEREQIKTTDAKAKELRKVADRLITLGKRGTLHARRQAARVLRTRAAVRKLFDELAPRFSRRFVG
jgi:large subunit ribosomal protein L17